jgi:perosamine synthetase
MVTTSDSSLADKLRLLRNLAFTQPRFRHDELGYNFRMTGYQAAMGLSQLRRIDQIIHQKRDLAARYTAALSSIPGLRLPREEPWAHHVYWMYGVLVGLEFPLSRDQLAARLREEGVETRTFFCPMGQQPCLLELPGYRPHASPVADRMWREGLYLPSSTRLSDADVDHVVASIAKSAAR